MTTRPGRQATVLGLLTILVSGTALGQDSVRDIPHTLIESQQTIVEMTDPEAGQDHGPGLGEQLPATMIGLEAYRSVIETGQYLVGPGDEFLIHSTSLKEPFVAVVLAEGGIFLPGVGRVHLAGLSLREAHVAVSEAFRRSVRVGEVHMELSRPRKFPVPIVGLVVGPGIVISSAVERVSEVIRKAQGLSDNASTRNIRLIRTADLEASQVAEVFARARQGDFGFLDYLVTQRLDLELYYLTGNSRYNPFVVDGDIVVVPPRQSMIRGLEAVQKSAVFEYVAGDRVSDLLQLCMGFAPHFDKQNVYLFRYDESGNRQFSQRIDVDGMLTRDPDADIELRPGDWLVARSRPDYQQASTVRLTGEVGRPGFYVVGKDGEGLQRLVERAGGLTPRAALSKARVVRPVSAEEARDPEFERILSIPPGERREDEEQYFNMKSRERRGQMVVDFAALFERQDESYDILLMPGDAVDVPARQNTVTVSGQAANPGVLTYRPGALVSDYVNRAGGPGWRASRDVRVIKARTGEIRRVRDVEQIDPGDRIWIKEKPEREYWRIFTQTMNVVGQVSTIVLLYVTILK